MSHVTHHSSLATAPEGRRPVRGVLLGGWGHFDEVLREMDASGGALSLVGIAAANTEDGDLDAKTIASAHPCAAAARLSGPAAAMLRDMRPDFAIVSTRPDRIPVLAALAAENGCHLVAEKPLATDMDSLDALRRTVEETGVLVCSMLSARATPALAAAVAAIHEGAVGRPMLLNARKTYKWGASRPAWFGDRVKYGGTIPWVGVHALDFIDAATGGDPVAEVSAFHANLAHAAFPDCEDVCALAMRLRSGALATATLDYLRPQADCPHGDDGLRVVGDRGELTVEITRGSAVLLAAGEAARPLALPPATPFYAPWLLALPPRGERVAPDERTLRAFRLTREALAAREAADTGRLFSIGS